MTGRTPVAVVYHFFALYRRSVLEWLRRSPDLRVILVADRKNRLTPGVPVWTIPEEIEFRPARCFPLPAGIMFQSGLLRLAFDRELQVIVYLGNWRWPMTWVSAALARIMGKRVLFWTHGWLKPPTGILRWIRNAFYRIPHGLLLYGNRARNIAIENGFDPARLYVVFNSLDYRTHVQIRQSLSPDDIRATRIECFGECTTPVVICSGRLVKEKRLDMLLYAVHQLKQQQHPVHVILIGDGPERSTLTELATRCGLRVHFAGACFDEATIGRLTMAAHATVCPGAAGLTVVQSLTFGRPVIASDALHQHAPEIEAIIPGRTGDFFRSGDVNDLAQVIRRHTQHALPDESRQSDCHRVVEGLYNPQYQVSVLRQAIQGVPAVPVRVADVIPESDS